jgi:NADH-quinone oxidoreductase subunit L
MSLVLIVFLPLLSAAFCGAFRSILSKKIVGFLASLLISIASIIAITLFAGSISENYIEHITLFSWIKADNLSVNWAIYADHLTLIMYVVICTVSAVVHIYSIGYMRDDARFNTFMSYLSLFTFFMLMLVSADNLVQMFFGWEGVGLCSYLLIGFWYTKESAAMAAKKAFIVNRFADVALLIGILIIYHQCHSFNFKDIKLSFDILDLTCLLLFIGCMGKSAQIGLHVWLPDAMEGPTPVSALIHAATMVTAGVFLVARMHFLFEQSNAISLFIATVGGITCLFAALIAVLQTDIKKIIAYSTCSQLGYMFIACGFKAYHAAIFHLATHAFYKAALFLAAGNVIHGTSSQELDKIGNVRANMKATFGIFSIASFAIMGVPPFAGFYSKDLILEYAHSANLVIFSLGVIAAFFTGFYSVKILKNVFTGANNSHAHEADMVMLLPMTALVIGSIFAGYFGINQLYIDQQQGYFNQIFKINDITTHPTNVWIQHAPLISSLLGGFFGWLYSTISNNTSWIFKIIKNKFYFDEIYNLLVVSLVEVLATLTSIFDKYVVDKLGPRNLVSITDYFSNKISRLHNGYIFSYALCMLLSVLCITIYFVVNV